MRVGSGADPFLAAALGMLLYTTITSPGYFLARHELPVVGVFAVLIALTIASPIVVFAEHRHCHGSAICPGQPLGVTRRFANVVCTVISAPMEYGEAIIVDHLNSAETDQSQLVIYDREIGVRLLYRDPDWGRSTISSATRLVSRYGHIDIPLPKRS